MHKIPPIVALLITLCAFGNVLATTVTRGTVQTEAVIGIDGSLEAEEDILLLEGIPSNLDFKARPVFADDNDFAAQLELRDSRFWGRLYVEGWPQPIQYLRAHFGLPPPMGQMQVVLANPPMACSTIDASHTANAIVLAFRGECPYGVKSAIALQANASVLLVVNNEDGIHHIPAPDVHDIELSVNMIGKDDGSLLAQVLAEQSLHGYMVPINCAKNSNRGGDQLCDATTAIEREVITSMNSGGVITDFAGTLNSMSLEYLLSTFGAPVSSTALQTAHASPPDACESLINKGEVAGKAVFVRRGSCPFLTKAIHAQEAGANAVIFVNNDDVLSRVGVEPRWRGYDITIPAVLTSQRAMEAVADVGAIMLTPLQAVSSAVWREIEELRQKASWPREKKARQALKQQLVEKHSSWPDRVAAIESFFAKLDS